MFFLKIFLTLFVSSYFTPVIGSDDPDWFVNITTKVNGETITGVGYIVQVGDDYYIRTASHVTLGTDSGTFITGKKEKLTVKLGQSIVDNAHDDQLIPIAKPENSTSIAFYSPTVKNFVVWPNRSREIKKESRKKIVEHGFDPAFYIVPKSMRRSKKTIPFKPLDESINTGYSPSFNYSNYLRTVKGKVSLTADMKVIPGESGSPLFKDILVGYDIKDANGKHYQYPLPNMSGGATILLGHTQSYQRYVDRSNFSAPKQSENIVKAIKDKTRIDNSVKWARYDNIFYRYKMTEKGLIQELNNLKDQSGNKTGGNGSDVTTGGAGNKTGGNGSDVTTGGAGNKTGGNGSDVTTGGAGNKTGGNGSDVTTGGAGNKTGGNGADISTSRLDLTGETKIGMIYHDRAVTAFKVKIIKNDKIVKEYTLYADWENYQYLEDLKRDGSIKVEIKPVEFTGKNLSELIMEKNKKSDIGQSFGRGYMRRSRCVIDGSALLYNHLNLNIQPFEVISVPLDEKLFPIIEVKNKDDGEMYKIDLRGLFSVDVMEFSEDSRKDEFTFYDDNSYVLLRAEGYKYSRAKCKVDYSISYGIRSRLFKGGKLEKEIIFPFEEKSKKGNAVAE